MNKLTITVTTAPGRPSFAMPADATPAQVRDEVFARYGAQDLFVQHISVAVLESTDTAPDAGPGN